MAIVNTKDRAEYDGAIKGTSITIEIHSPIILVRYFGQNGDISTIKYHSMY